ncbi:MAG: AraC family transcriptional regulator [Rhizomicrobium sp.]|jgi:AraC family transcriptional regulator
MTPIEKAVWFIESHFAEGIALDDVAQVSGVSRHHLVRAFGAATGRSVMRYVRARRLTEAARVLAAGAPDILAVALDAGYASHEAFTRAFREEFGIAPEQVRANGTVSNLLLMEPAKMSESGMLKLPEPHRIDGKAMLLAGLSERYNDVTIAGVPAQWQRFAPHIGHIPGEIFDAAYGVCYNGDDEGNVDYMTGVEVRDYSGTPSDLARLRLAAQLYLVFEIKEHISSIRTAWNTLWNVWLPQSGHALADAPFFERYGSAFNPQTGAGGYEFWLPLKP